MYRRSARPGLTKNSAPSKLKEATSFHSVKNRKLDEKYTVNWRQVLGEGAYGKVYLAKSIDDRTQRVALKKIDKLKTSTVSFRMETSALIRIHENGGHPNICGLRDMYQDFAHYYLIMDLVPGGEMFDHLVDFGAYSEADASRLMREVASAMAFLHGSNIVHADLKPENILISSSLRSNGTIKIVDFGSAIVTDKLDPRRDKIKASGTTAYWSPERVKLAKYAPPTAEMDMWSVGVVLFIMLAGVHPYDTACNASDDQVARTLLKNPDPPTSPWLDHLSHSARDIICKLLEKDPTLRYTAEQMLEHPWIVGTEASTRSIEGSNKRLAKYRRILSDVQVAVLQTMLTKAQGQHEKQMDIVQRAFEVFDSEGKGFITSKDVDRVTDSGARGVSLQKRASVVEEMNLSDFAKVFNDLQFGHFKRDQVIYSEGSSGDTMYFIRSGKVSVVDSEMGVIYTLHTGDFFGEECLLNPEAVRSTTMVCATPVDVFQITKSDFDRLSERDTSGKKLLESAFYAKNLRNLKTVIWIKANVQSFTLYRGDEIFRQGQIGDAMFLVNQDSPENKVDLIRDDQRVFSCGPSDMFGENAFLFEGLREETAVVASEQCSLSKIYSEDFQAILQTQPDFADALEDMNRKRKLKVAAALLANRSFSFGNLRKVFDSVDLNGDGFLNRHEIKQVIHKMDPLYPEAEIDKLMNSIDLNEDDEISYEEFEKIFHWEMLSNQ